MTSDTRPAGAEATRHPLRGLLVSQAIGAFNDNAWKGVVVLLAMALVATETAKQKEASVAQIVFMVPLFLFSLPAGVLADRVSKRTVIVGMKVTELALMLAGCVVLFRHPTGGVPALAILGLLGVQAALFGPAKYGILPEILPHDKLSSGNGLLEMWTNLAIIAGLYGGGVIADAFKGAPWVGGVVLAGLSGAGLAAALLVPRVAVARAEGGMVTSVRIAWQAIRSDRILRLAIVGQILVWSIASLIPAPVQAYAKGTLNLRDRETGLPMAAMGIGIGLGCVAAGRLSASKVEYGLLPLGALGLTITTLLFALIQPHLAGTLVLMGLIGVSAGLLFVPLNALVQWHSPHDGRGAVIALANVLIYAGMLAGSVVAYAMAGGGISARGTFLGASAALAAGTVWAFTLVPDAFLRFVLIMLAHTLYRVRILGRTNVPQEGGALLTPNHVSFVDGLFVIAAIDRPVRFIVYAEYFKGPLLGRFLRSMRAIPIASSGGPKMILQAFREAGRALDDGELVCIFPEGQITRTGMSSPFLRGLERIVKGRSTPIIPVHLDRATASIFSPLHGSRLPERIPLPVTVSFGAPMPTTTPLFQIRQAIRDLDQEAWIYRKGERRPLHHDFIRQARHHPLRLGMADLLRPRLSMIGALAGAVALARALRPRWKGQASVGILLPTGVAATLVNLASALTGRAAVNLNFTTGRAALSSAAAQAGLRTVITSPTFLEKAKVELPEGVEVIWIEQVRDSITRRDRLGALLLACLAPVRWLERAAGAARPVSVDDAAAIIFSSGSTGDPKGVVLSHFNVDSNLAAIAQVHRAQPGDRVMDVLPPFHSFGYMIMWLALNRALPLICHTNPLDAAAIGGLIERYAATVMMATPTFLQLYVRRCAPAQFGSLRLVLAGAEKLPESLDRLFEDTFGVRLHEGYGATECAPVIAVSGFDYRAPGFFQPGMRRGFVGQPLPGVSVRIVQPETGAALGPNEPGMVLVKGPNVMRGYLGRPDLTAAAIHDGWYTTGDIGLLDVDGFLKITGRLSRFSKIGGEMVPHGRVEEALHEAIGVDLPQVFAVTAVADDRGSERLAVLYTVPDEKANEALSKLPSLGLPNLFLPRPDHMIKVDTLPVLGTGKSDLRGVRRLAEERLQVMAKAS
jgi:acyl-[acyl-carrier-protein]-phospholipid O-acyltransferase/long-chain-fatty-acid--[acyl-carrier-protein] ligase